MSTPESQQPNPGWEWYHPTTISGLPVCFSMSSILAWKTGSTASTLTPCGEGREEGKEGERRRTERKKEREEEEGGREKEGGGGREKEGGGEGEEEKVGGKRQGGRRRKERVKESQISIPLSTQRRRMTHRPTLGHGKDVDHSDSVVIYKLSKHQPHHLHWYTSTTCEGVEGVCVCEGGGGEEDKDRTVSMRVAWG